MGVQQALGDMDLVAVSDIEPGPLAVERHRYPDARQLGDISKVDWNEVGSVDVICGGSPCQSMSFAGKRAGMHDGTRSGLWSYQADAIRALQPRIATWENVLGALGSSASCRMSLTCRERYEKRLREHNLCDCAFPEFPTDPAFKRPFVKATVRERLDAAYLPWLLDHAGDPATVRCETCGMPVYERTADGWRAGDDRLDGAPAPCMRALGRVLADLSDAGYDCVWRVLEAADVGAPHHRARVFVTGFRRDAFDRMRPAGDPWASYDADLDVWTTGQADLFGEPDVFDGVWPKSGVVVDGCAYRLPERMLALTSRPGVPPATPTASDADHAGPNQRYGAGNSPLPAQMAGLGDDWMLPTPTARDGGGGGALSPERKRAGGHAVTLQDVTEAGGLLSDGTDA